MVVGGVEGQPSLRPLQLRDQSVSLLARFILHILSVRVGRTPGRPDPTSQAPIHPAQIQPSSASQCYPGADEHSYMASPNTATSQDPEAGNQTPDSAILSGWVGEGWWCCHGPRGLAEPWGACDRTTCFMVGHHVPSHCSITMTTYSMLRGLIFSNKQLF